MKKLYVFIFAVLVILSACASPNAESTNANAKNNNDTDEQAEENTQKDEDKEAPKEEEENTDKQANDETSGDNTEEKTADQASNPSPEYEISQETWQVKPIDDANEQVLLLTIDDAPDEHALEMAHTLKDLDANAIFFVNGHFLETDEEKEALQTIHDMGFLIGNHTYSHAYLPDLTPEEQREEIIEVSDMIEDVIGKRPAFFRAPNGANTDTSRKIAEEENMVTMNWSYGYDFKKDYMTKEAITDKMINTELLQSGANLLMHDREWTNAALEDIVTGLRDKGYEMVDPDLIKTKKD